VAQTRQCAPFCVENQITRCRLRTPRPPTKRAFSGARTSLSGLTASSTRVRTANPRSNTNHMITRAQDLMPNLAGRACGARSSVGGARAFFARVYAEKKRRGNAIWRPTIYISTLQPAALHGSTMKRDAANEAAGGSASDGIHCGNEEKTIEPGPKTRTREDCPAQALCASFQLLASWASLSSWEADRKPGLSLPRVEISGG